MLTPLAQLTLTESQRRVALTHNILAVDYENIALLHQPERGNGVYVLNQYARPQGAAVTDDLLLVLHRHGTPQRQWRFYHNRDADALQRARRQLQSP